VKKIFSVCLAVLLIFASLVSPAFASGIAGQNGSDLSVIIDGEKQNYSVSPVIEKGTVLVPMRAVFESLGASLKWEAESQTVKAEKGDIEIQLKVGSYFAQKNGEAVKLMTPAIIVNDSVLVPLRFVSEALGAEVYWDQLNRSAVINTGEKVENSVSEVKEEDKAVNSTLTYKQAFEAALKNSIAYKNAQADIERSEEVRNKAAENFFFTPIGTGNGPDDALAASMAIGVARADVAWQMAKKQLSVEGDKLAYNVLKAYQEILKKEQEKEFADLGLKRARKQAEITNFKYVSGMVSQFEQDQAQNTLREEIKKAEAAAKALTDARQKLNSLLGVSEDKVYELLDKPKLVKLDMDEEGLGVHINRMTSDSTAAWLADQNVKLAEMTLNLYVFNDPSNPNPYRAVQIDLDKARNAAADTKKQLADSTRALYYNIKQLEDQYEILQTNLAKAEDSLKVLRLRYDLGMATESELLDAEYQVAQLKNNLYSLAIQHEQLKTAFAMPWVLGA